MTALHRLTVAETRLFLRDPVSVIFGVLFPTALLLGLGAIPALREPADEFGGVSFVEAWAPAALALGLGIIALQQIPVAMATYRERGVLRRMSTTPVHPGAMLASQLLVALGAAVVAGLLVVLSAWAVLGVPLPQQPLLFAAVFVVGFGALLAVGTLIAAVAATLRLATGLATLAYVVAMFAGGVFLPQFLLPDALVRLSAYVPPGVPTLLDTWSGAPAAAGGLPVMLQVAIMAVLAVAVGGAAAKLFRWE
ncbi:ABC transporter permease [Cellulomonas phragmiteti]|uniref:Transport permease protein n=1 Tax=Cellulomonas phragmiteti TaxID=478780 RepID=A0ABQ4DMS5_9CELL|nr:ABC transporter permease [Cellulomonas phragmiteti]GIG40655.1 transport permease protein [Cellulomonas phragmiteti]